MNQPYFTGTNAALFTDLYELTMAQAYVAEGMLEPATFSLFYRRLPADRNYVLSCGAEDVADFVCDMGFSDDDLEYLRGTGTFSDTFLDYLAGFRFTGDVMAVPDGTPMFPNEPLVEVTAPAPEAQIVETWVLNQVQAQSVLATKAARIVAAARGLTVLDFGLRRIHGADNGLKAARAFHIAGVTATSNVLAGRIHGIPISGTMAHSYVQAHDSEMEAFRRFASEFPETVLLVDTYDTRAGVEKVVALKEELGDNFRVRGVRIDSGDLDELSKAAREMLDRAGLEEVQIFVSGGLDEFGIETLLADDAPIDGFGVGTSMGISPDAPELDIAYKLVEYAGRGRMKLSTGKPTMPGAKQVFRTGSGDTIARRDEKLGGVGLLEPLVEGGERARSADTPDRARDRAAERLQALPDTIRSIHRTEQDWPVDLSDALESHRGEVQRWIGRDARDR